MQRKERKERIQGRIQWRAVLIGYLVDYVATFVLSLVAFASGVELAGDSMFATTAGTVFAVLGLLATVAGGWVAGRIARDERFLHGFLVGGVSIFMLLLESLFGAVMSLDVLLLTFAATGLAGLAGYLSRWRPARERGK